MQASDSEQPQSVAMTQSTAMKRKKVCDKDTLSKQRGYSHVTTSEDEETRANISPVKTFKRDLAQKGAASTSPPTNNIRICKFESLFCRSHSIDDSTIQTMSTGRMPKATIINDR